MDNCTTCAYSDTISGKGKTYQFGTDSIRFEEKNAYFCMKRRTKEEIPKNGCKDYATKAAPKETCFFCVHLKKAESKDLYCERKNAAVINQHTKECDTMFEPRTGEHV